MIPAPTGALADALLAARMSARDPRLGGMLVSGGGAAAREAVLAAFVAALPAGAPVRRVPATIDEDRLLGGLDLGAALAGEGARFRPGLLCDADGGLVVLPAPERLSPGVTALIGAALDRGEIDVARDGVAATMPVRFAVAAFEEEDDGGSPTVHLRERLAFHVRLDDADGPADAGSADPIAADDIPDLLVAMADALGIASARAPAFALRAARASAALAGRAGVAQADIACAARLVLAPRATRLPPAPDEPASEAPDQPAPGAAETDSESRVETLEDRMIAATRAAIDPGLIAGLEAGRATRGHGSRARGAGERRRARTRGRLIGVRAGEPRGGARLALVATLRTAAPWQALRGRIDRVIVAPSDLRIHRYEARAELVTIFAVDASGSAAAARLAEAKGAVELLLAQAYVQRAEVALVVFRGMVAELLLPPTRSLTRARRALAEVPGGGGTPLAGGIAAARALALAVRAKGRTPFVVILSDGRANIAADGAAGRAAADRDALAAARLVAADRIAAAFIDTGPRARPEGARIAAAMGARYVPLPFARAEAVEAAVSALAPRRA